MARLASNLQTNPPVRDSVLANYLLYQAGWFACVLGSAWHRPWLGFAIGLVLLLLQIALATDRRRDARLIGLAVAVGFWVEVLLLATGTYSFTSGTFAAVLPPAWMLLMWAQFGATFPHSLKPIIKRPVLAAVFSALGGPIAFIAGQGLGAVTLLPPVSTGLLRLAVCWAIAMTVLSTAARSYPDD